MNFASEHRPTQAIINLSAISHNIKEFRGLITVDQEIYAVVKADGYGHGAVPVAKAALEAGATGLCVATVDEAIELRQAGLIQVPILVLGLTSPYGIAEILHYNITITVSNIDFFVKAYEQLEHSEQTELLNLYQLKFHLKLDTGMSRIGLQSKTDIRTFYEQIKGFTWAVWEGVFTHFATAGGGPSTYIQQQWERWEFLLEEVPESVKIRHFANSAMAMYPNYNQKSDIIRLGIAMYGLHPKDLVIKQETYCDEEFEHNATFDQMLALDLQPALQLVSELVYVKKVPSGTSVSYGATYTSQEEEWIGTVPIGYADGWLRAYHSVPVLVEGYKCSVLGVINMDQMMIRLPKAFPIGTEVTLIGMDGGLNNHASSIARQVDTISYELVTSIGARVPRIYI
ncbi:alanine racemase [Facklamia lactis]|uniref:alanine racemase n=1 Tax=Facklamia lactis TaxID=2749967 RepID=UPI0018CE5A6A|nr:alanine racemase [Facklamia lactis]MBG9980773.1 alanine racemase [Facklamia lactis]